MTREEIEAMVPGRDLDMLVAEKIMGLTVIVERRPDGATWVKEAGKQLYALPNYSTDISAAWEVIEKLMADGYGYYLGNEDEDHCAGFIAPWPNERRVEVTCKTAPEAIAKVALLAVVDKEDTHD